MDTFNEINGLAKQLIRVILVWEVTICGHLGDFIYC